MRAAFSECYRVLKPGKWMHVTFHHTDVATFTGLVDVAQTAGFTLQLVTYQPSLRMSDKALAQPYGSAVGNYYLRFHKSSRPNGVTGGGTMPTHVYEKIVVDSVTRMLAKRGEPTSMTQILNEIYVDLSKKGVMVAQQRAPVEVLKASSRFEVIDSADRKLWWFVDPSEIAGLETIPLSERIETAVLSVLRRKVKVTFDEVLQEVLINFPNSLTPASTSVMDYLEAYAVKDPSKKGIWKLKPQAEVSAVESEHSRVIAELAELGQQLGFPVSIGKNERSHSWAGGTLADLEKKNPGAIPAAHLDSAQAERTEQIDLIWYGPDTAFAAFEVENTTNITEGVVRMANLPQVSRRVVVVPQARANLLEKKLREPLLKAAEKQWTHLFYERVGELLAAVRRGELHVDSFLDALETEAQVAPGGQGKLTFDE